MRKSYLYLCYLCDLRVSAVEDFTVSKQIQEEVEMQRYITTSLMLVLLGSAILWAGCGGPSTEATRVAQAQPTGEAAAPAGERVVGQITDIKVPDWFVNIPEDPNYMYAVATHASKDLQQALDDAKISGRADIASQLEVKVTGLFKRFREEVGLGEDAELLGMTTTVTKDVVSEVLRLAKVAKQEVTKEGNLYKVYILMESSTGDMNAAVVDKVKAQKDMYTRFRASQGFKELEEEVEKYEQWKKEQEQG
jgi:hypothetical protein